MGFTEEPYSEEAAFTYSYSPASAANGMYQDFNVLEDASEDNGGPLGSGAPIAFILILLLVLMVAAAVVGLTVGRKKDDEEESEV